jgi:hypothetical protein
MDHASSRASTSFSSPSLLPFPVLPTTSSINDSSGAISHYQSLEDPPNVTYYASRPQPKTSFAKARGVVGLITESLEKGAAEEKVKVEEERGEEGAFPLDSIARVTVSCWCGPRRAADEDSEVTVAARGYSPPTPAPGDTWGYVRGDK